MLVFFGLFGLMIWGKSAQTDSLPASENTNATSSLSVVGKSAYDFGVISMKNGKVKHRFTITNPTSKAVMLKTVVTSCMCTKAYVYGGTETKGPFGMLGMGYVPSADEIIKPGESREIEAEFDPNAHGPAGVGPIARAVTLTEESGGIIEFNFKAEVTP